MDFLTSAAYFVHRVGGNLLTVRRFNPLLQTTLRVLHNDGLADRVGSAARAYVTEHQSWGAVAGVYERVYREVLEQQPAVAETAESGG